MESFLACGYCKLKFNFEENEAKILPCSCTMCLKCLQETKNDLEEYTVICSSCNVKHHIADLNKLLTSKIITHILKNSTVRPSATDSSIDADSNEKKSLVLESFSDELKLKFESQKMETFKHYESLLIDIDTRTEKIIEVTKQKRMF